MDLKNSFQPNRKQRVPRRTEGGGPCFYRLVLPSFVCDFVCFTRRRTCAPTDLSAALCGGNVKTAGTRPTGRIETRDHKSRKKTTTTTRKMGRATEWGGTKKKKRKGARPTAALTQLPAESPVLFVRSHPVKVKVKRRPGKTGAGTAERGLLFVCFICLP